MITSTRNGLYWSLMIACTAGYGWIFYTLNYTATDFGGCLIKHATNFPCPSCGSTRAILALMSGNLNESLMLNPMGAIIAIILIITPAWIAFDVVSKRSSLYLTYQRCELFLGRKSILIVLFALIAVNWIWNIEKGL